MSDTLITLSVETDDPNIAPLVDAMNAATDREKPKARAALLTALALNEAKLAGYSAGRRDGLDEGAAPFLDGPWWRRAWTAARS